MGSISLSIGLLVVHYVITYLLCKSAVKDALKEIKEKGDL